MLLAAMFVFCAKESKRIEESPFFVFFEDNGILIDTVKSSADSWEYGFVFTPLKNGSIAQFSTKIPAPGNYKVTLWDLSGSSPVAIRTVTVTTSPGTDFAKLDIPEISLDRGKKYGVTVLSNAFYRVTRTGNNKFAYPREQGNIRIESFNESVNNTSNAEFPNTPTDTRVAPCVNVIFIAD